MESGNSPHFKSLSTHRLHHALEKTNGVSCIIYFEEGVAELHRYVLRMIMFKLQEESPKLGKSTKFWLEDDSCDVVDTGGITIPAPGIEPSQNV